MNATRFPIPCRAALAAAALVFSLCAWPADPPSAPSATPTAPSKELREKMAAVHEQMAACLRSDKGIDQCHADMMANCRTAAGAQGCPMMGMGRGMGRHHTMQPAPGGTPK